MAKVKSEKIDMKETDRKRTDSKKIDRKVRKGSDKSHRSKLAKSEKSHQPSSVWKGSISFGLVSIPVQISSTQQEQKLHFKMVDERDLSPVGYQNINKKTGKLIERKNIVKAYEFKKGEFVIFKDQDFKKANVKATGSVDIEDFVDLDEIDPLFFEKPYYIIPQEGAEKGYALLREVLSQSRKVGIAKIVLHTSQRLCAIMVRGKYLILETLRFADEVKETHEVDYLNAMAEKADVSDRELKIAKQLVEGMSSPWNPEKYRNTYRDDIMKMVENKVKRNGTKEIEEPEHETPDEEISDNVIDLTALLKKSLSSRKRSSKREPTHGATRA